MTITDIQFTPCKPRNGHLGFVSFIYNKTFFCGSIAVYTRLHGGIRLVYPKLNVGDKQLATFFPNDKDISEKIENKIEKKIDSLLEDLSKRYK